MAFAKGHPRFPTNDPKATEDADAGKPRTPFDNLGDAPTVFERGQPMVRPVEVLRRVNIPDIDSFSWAIPTLSEQMGINGQGVAMKMRVWSGDQSYSFLMQGAAFGLAQAWREPDGDLLVWERFVMSKDREESSINDALAVYAAFWRWGQSMGCREMRLASQRPVPDHLLAGVTGKLVPRPSIAILITPQKV